jgi:hypothetical protein
MWPAINLVAKHEPEVKARLGDLFPVMPRVTGNGHARLITTSFERAFGEASAIPMNVDPSRRKGSLDVELALKTDGGSGWILEAKATLSSHDKGGLGATAFARTHVTGKDPAAAVAEGQEELADALARSLIAEVGKRLLAMGPTPMMTTRIAEAEPVKKARVDVKRRARR